MRSSVLMYIGLMLTILQLVILTNITAKSSYADSIRESLENSLERSINLTRQDASLHFDNVIIGTEQDDIYDSGSMSLNNATSLGDFKRRFVENLNADLDPRIENLTVNIFGADEEKGLLSAEVIAEFQYIGGQTGRVSVRRTVILNKIKK